jgi:exopolysaccharide biosynthesis polyprenyl glycosylphosphotransferase
MAVITPNRVSSSTHEFSSARHRPRAAEDLEIGAGNEGSVPRAFLAFADLAALALAFVIAGQAAPWVQWLLLPSGPLALSLPPWMSLPEAPTFESFPTLASVAWVLVVTGPMTVFFMQLLGGYREILDQSRTRVFFSSVMSPTIALSFLTMAFFATKTSSSSRVFVFTFGAVAVGTLLVYRSSLRVYKRRRLAAGEYLKNLIIVGSPMAVDLVARHLREHIAKDRYSVVGWLATSQGSTSGSQSLPMLGDVDTLSQLLISNPIHEVVAVQSSSERDWLQPVIESCDYYRVRLRIVPLTLLTANIDNIDFVFRSGPLKLPEIVLEPPHLDSDALFFKRLIDIVVSAFLLALLTPLFALVALAIKLTTPSLPVFYSWRVIGLKGRPFVGYKFTTMVRDAESLQQQLLAHNEMVGPVFKVKNDPRMTPLGRFLRKYSINELPQLWSVLKGDMSLVGPRPAFRHELERYELWHKRKLCVKPGITCLWQVMGRNRITSFDEWVRLDLKYIDEWTLWLDFRILVRTVIAVFSGSGS